MKLTPNNRKLFVFSKSLAKRKKNLETTISCILTCIEKAMWQRSHILDEDTET